MSRFITFCQISATTKIAQIAQPCAKTVLTYALSSKKKKTKYIHSRKNN